MSANTGSKIAIVVLFCIIFAVIGVLVYDLVFYYPRAVLSFTNDLSSAKTDIPFKLNVNVTSLNYIAKDCVAGLDIVAPDGRATTVSEQVLSLSPGKTVPLVFETVVSSNKITGNYTAVVYLSGRRSVLFGKPGRFAELRKDFTVIQKRIDGTLALRTPSESMIRKPGEKLVFTGSAANTGETEQLLSVDCIITPPVGVEINLGVQAKTLGPLEQNDFSFTFTAPSTVSGKYTARVSLFAGNPNLPSGQKLKQIDRKFTVTKLSGKAASVKTKSNGGSKADAKYKAAVSVGEKQGEDGNPGSKLNGPSELPNVSNNPPLLSNLVYIAPAPGKPGIITTMAKADNGIKDVRLVYKGPGMSEYARESMIKTGGRDNLKILNKFL